MTGQAIELASARLFWPSVIATKKSHAKTAVA
jgi:hypothetical protein